eukprot:CAMPEP_0183731034 /NCGR_PEP_ID=MMETSP0737-20130205/34188_1 /TAXON_ID=385413 /ORGANISM="Thalassiosira miniscula, Strain CCMP1093" /LENGTH=765 /DNA_ID=CAMNT_0025963661 /DNA_START=392 /DNA_END=2689 /DNA_ORIENTATION=-
MNKWKRKRLHPAIILLGFTFHLFGCKCFDIRLPPRVHHCHRLQQLPASQLQSLRTQTILRASTKPGSSDDRDNEEDQSKSVTIRERLGQIGTFIGAFSLGSLSVVIFTMVLFHWSLSRDYHTSFTAYQNSDTNKPFSSNQFNGKNIADSNDQKQKAVKLYRYILEQLDSTYVDEVQPEALFETTTRAMLSTLDPYTEYISPQDLMKRKPQVGIGAFVMKAGSTPELLDGKPVSTLLSLVSSAVALPTQLPPSQDLQHSNSQDDGFHVVLSLQGYAYDAGLRVGDEILEIDDQSVVGVSLERVRELLTGVPGTKVKLSFKRPGIKEAQSIYVERNVVQFPNIPYAGILSNDPTLFTKTNVAAGSHDGIGYIRLRRFGKDAGVSMERALQSIQADTKKGLILDLRDNSGGELLSAVHIASLFLPNDSYLGSSEGKGAMYPNESYRSGKLDLTQYGYVSSDNFPKSRNSMSPNSGVDVKQVIDTEKTNIVILTNKRTASASEFLAGVFQDLDKGVIIGSDESTLGKGIGQREIGLPYGEGALKLTYHEFYTPSGRCVQRQFQEGIKKQDPQKKQNELEKVFYTTNGREVNNRKGIEVDYRVKPKSSILSSLLSSSGAYFSFATEFNSRHQWLSNGSADFTVDDKIYNDFRSFVIKEQKRGNLKLEESFDDKHQLEKIKKLAVDSKLQDSNLIQSSVANLEGKIVQDLLSDFDSCKDIIRNELEQNILAHQLPDSELIGRGLNSDELVKEAVRIIENTERYRELLGKTT